MKRANNRLVAAVALAGLAASPGHIKVEPVPVQQNSEVHLTFVEVAQPATEAPTDTKYYSSQNSRAADPANRDKDVPQLNGKQTLIVKTEDAPRPDINKLQPARPAPPQALQPVVKPGDLTLGKPEDSRSRNSRVRAPSSRRSRSNRTFCPASR